MPYRSAQILLTTWTVCVVCRAVVAHLDQPAHDDWHAQQEQPPVEDDPGRGLALTA